MIVEAAFEAYEDAGIENPQQQIEAVFCGAQYPSKGTAEVADALKLFDRPVSMVRNYCATGTDAFRYGVFAVACGMYDTVLVVGFDKPKDRGVSGPSVAVTGVRGLPMTPAGWFSLCAAQYFETYGAGREDLAKIAVKNHHNGTLAPKSMLKREITVEDVLKAPHHLVAVRPLRLRRAVRRRRRRDPHPPRAGEELPRRLRAGARRSASRSRRTRRRIRASTSCAGSRPCYAAQAGLRAGRHHQPVQGDRRRAGARLLHADRAAHLRGPRLLREGLGEGAHRQRHLRARRRAAGQHRRRPQDLRPSRPAPPACA